MQGYIDDIERLTKDNGDYRRVLYTGKNIQLVLMAIQPGDEIGAEVHEDHDQFFRIDEGDGEVEIDGKRTPISDGFAVIVPAGARHNVINTGSRPLKLYTLYAPPEHRDGVVVRTKAEETEEHFDGETTEG